MKYLIQLPIILIIALLTSCNSIPNNVNTESFCHANEFSSRLPSCGWEDLIVTGKRDEFDEHMASTITKVLEHYKAPVKDGNKYTGEISFCVDREGVVDKIKLSRPSGHKELDIAFYQAVIKTEKFPVPIDPCLADKFYFARVVLRYDETDMADK